MENLPVFYMCYFKWSGYRSLVWIMPYQTLTTWKYLGNLFTTIKLLKITCCSSSLKAQKICLTFEESCTFFCLSCGFKLRFYLLRNLWNEKIEKTSVGKEKPWKWMVGGCWMVEEPVETLCSLWSHKTKGCCLSLHPIITMTFIWWPSLFSGSLKANRKDV